ncbi:hypothetical protein D9757_006893 [Collybiopsis confluens]|uniref:Uncharacterized protein n=1 Tax=Collybiopsis confluens TaxID=2823264 RepID=A0A8H5HQC6_9AGAR|nr:hypothetical protein D9757_006893 [Collybiopsis confluens]
MLPIIILLIIAVLALVSLSRLPVDKIRDDTRPLNFETDRNRWFTGMEQQFTERNVSDDRRTRFAIEAGLKPHPDLQGAMQDRQAQYLILSNQIFTGQLQPVEIEDFVFVDSSAKVTYWPWDEFKDDISRVDDAKKDLSVRSVSVLDIAQSQIHPRDLIQAALSEVLENVNGINLPEIHFPSKEEFLRWLKRAKDQLDQALRDGSSKAEDVLRTIEHFVSVQIQQLPDEVRKAIEQFNRFRHEHPYIIAAGTVVLVIIGMELILPWAFLGILRMFGFAEIGPVAGSWAAALQSIVYGARTRGLFSILQRITMSAKRFWPVAVFLDLATLAAGTIAVWASGAIKDIVDAWHLEMSRAMIPDLNLIVRGNPVAEGMFDNWIEELGKKCAEAGIPEVQWLDVAIQSITKVVEDLVSASDV